MRPAADSRAVRVVNAVNRTIDRDLPLLQIQLANVQFRTFQHKQSAGGFHHYALLVKGYHLQNTANLQLFTFLHHQSMVPAPLFFFRQNESLP